MTVSPPSSEGTARRATLAVPETLQPAYTLTGPVSCRPGASVCPVGALSPTGRATGSARDLVPQTDSARTFVFIPAGYTEKHQCGFVLHGAQVPIADPFHFAEEIRKNVRQRVSRIDPTRDDTIVEQYQSGLCLASVAALQGLSIERIRQILKSRDVSRRPWGSNDKIRSRNHSAQIIQRG